MKIADLKTILAAIDDTDEVAVSIIVNGNEKFPVVTHAIGYDKDECGDLILQVDVYAADFDYQEIPTVRQG